MGQRQAATQRPPPIPFLHHLLEASCLSLPSLPSDKAQWPSAFPACGGHLQSPIDIDTEATVFSPQLGDLLLSGYDLPPGERLCLQNNGHTSECLPSDGVAASGGCVESSYVGNGEAGQARH